jgi:hypothetical protein
MRIVRALLLLFMAFVVFLIVMYPATRHTKRMRLAFREYFHARDADKAGSTAETKRDFEEARLKLAEVKRLERRENIVFEVVMLGVLGAAMYVFVRAGRRSVDGRQNVTEFFESSK